jgi:hypothetical protein
MGLRGPESVPCGVWASGTGREGWREIVARNTATLLTAAQLQGEVGPPSSSGEKVL